MRKLISVLILTFAVVVATVVPRAAQAQEFKVIVNSANSVDALSADEASKIFLKQSAKFSNGTAANPVDHAKSSPVRAAFSKAVHGKPVSVIETFWQQQIFSGKEVPPVTKASDDDVVAFVKANAGGIGYVAAGAATAGVKVIAIK